MYLYILMILVCIESLIRVGYSIYPVIIIGLLSISLYLKIISKK
jgi:hypothetical protein